MFCWHITYQLLQSNVVTRNSKSGDSQPSWTQERIDHRQYPTETNGQWWDVWYVSYRDVLANWVTERGRLHAESRQDAKNTSIPIFVTHLEGDDFHEFSIIRDGRLDHDAMIRFRWRHDAHDAKASLRSYRPLWKLKNQTHREETGGLIILQLGSSTMELRPHLQRWTFAHQLGSSKHQCARITKWWLLITAI